VSILHLACNAATRPSRILKESATALRSGIAREVRILARAAPDHPNSEMLAPGVRVDRLNLQSAVLPKRGPFQVLKLLEWQRRAVAFGTAIRPSLVQAHGLCTLATALRIGREVRCPVIYDAHELETEQGQPRWRVPFDRAEERRLIRRPDAMLSVSESIADWYVARYGIARPHVIRNIPDVRMQPRGADRGVLRRRFGIADDALVFIYQGALSRGRRIEQLIRVFQEAGSSRHLVLMGYGELEGMVRAAADTSMNIHFHPAVPPAEVLQLSAGADVGICGGEDVCLSYFYSLPNKLFEYLVAGLPIMVPQWPEMTRIVSQFSCGWVVEESDQAWLSAITRVSVADIQLRRLQVEVAARTFSWESEERTLLSVYVGLLEGASS
jgi:glycosyltransferase involved in cell wall biosynthesis